MGKYDKYLIYDNPIPYRSLKVYPARMSQYLDFFTVCSVLLMEKNSVPDVKVISMSYLEYIIYSSDDENYNIAKMDFLLRLVFGLPKEDKKGSVKSVRYLTDRETGDVIIGIGEELLNKHDFKDIREIIIEQNMLTPPDESIQKSLRDDIERARRLRAKISGNKRADIEEQMIALSVSSGIPLEQIYEMTVRKFFKSIERIDHKIHYEIYLQAQMSGMVTFKNKSAIKHWLSDLNEDGLSEMMSLDSFEEKVFGAV